MKAIKVRDEGKVIAYIYSFLDYDATITDRDKFVDQLLKKIKLTSIGYAGYKNKEELKKELLTDLFYSESKLEKFGKNNKRVLDIIEDTIRRCHNLLKSKLTRVYVFPCFNTFVKTEMDGVTGSTPLKNTIHLYINPGEGWKVGLKNMVSHEFNHSILWCNRNPVENLLSRLIAEGLAETFKEEAIPGKTSSWAGALSQKDARRSLKKLEGELDSKNWEFGDSVLYGSKDYPKWAGYSIGYHVVKEFRRKNPELEWDEIMKIPAKRILEMSKFLKNSD